MKNIPQLTLSLDFPKQKFHSHPSSFVHSLLVLSSLVLNVCSGADLVLDCKFSQKRYIRGFWPCLYLVDKVSRDFCVGGMGVGTAGLILMIACWNNINFLGYVLVFVDFSASLD